jgi:hypothetical protein
MLECVDSGLVREAVGTVPEHDHSYSADADMELP